MTDNQLILNVDGNLQAADYGSEAKSGMEDYGAGDFNLPYLIILQRMSPQLDDSSDQFIKGAYAGMILNTMTSETYDGDKGVHIIPCAKTQHANELREEGTQKVFVRSHNPDSDAVKNAVWRDSKKRLPNGNILSDVTNYFCLLVDPQNALEYRKVIMSFKFMMLKDCKSLNGIIMNAAGKHKCPVFALVIKATTSNRKHGEHGFKGWEFSQPVALLDPEHPLYIAAKDYREFAVSYSESIREQIGESDDQAEEMTDSSDPF